LRGVFAIPTEEDEPTDIKLVEKVSRWQEMAGDNDAEKAINSYLTSTFVGKNNMPADECLAEARVILSIIKKS